MCMPDIQIDARVHLRTFAAKNLKDLSKNSRLNHRTYLHVVLPQNHARSRVVCVQNLERIYFPPHACSAQIHCVKTANTCAQNSRGAKRDEQVVMKFVDLLHAITQMVMLFKRL